MKRPPTIRRGLIKAGAGFTLVIGYCALIFWKPDLIFGINTESEVILFLNALWGFNLSVIMPLGLMGLCISGLREIYDAQGRWSNEACQDNPFLSRGILGLVVGSMLSVSSILSFVYLIPKLSEVIGFLFMLSPVAVLSGIAVSLLVYGGAQLAKALDRAPNSYAATPNASRHGQDSKVIVEVQDPEEGSKQDSKLDTEKVDSHSDDIELASRGGVKV